jgi:hypothetical protein
MDYLDHYTPPRYFHGAPIYQPRAALGIPSFPWRHHRKVFPVPDQGQQVKEGAGGDQEVHRRLSGRVPLKSNVAKTRRRPARSSPYLHRAGASEAVGMPWRATE